MTRAPFLQSNNMTLKLTVLISLCALLLSKSVTAAISCSRTRGKVTNGTKTYSSTLSKLPDAPFLQETSINGQYCSCSGENKSNTNAPLAPGTRGFTGVKCETSFEVCPNGQLVCFNGAQCVAEQVPYKVANITKNNYYYNYYYYYNDTGDYSNNTKYYCDCRPESKEVYSDDFQSLSYFAGVACEYESTAQCGAQNRTHLTDDGVADVNAGTWFCTNNGICNEAKSDVNEKCTCTPDYFGPHCEYHVDTAMVNITDDAYIFIPQVDQVCNLTCQNGGQCLFGIKDYSDAFSGPLEKYLGTNLNGMSCACPLGWTGLLCDIPMMVCSRDQICLNGGICTRSKQNSSDFACDCTNVISKYNYTSPNTHSSMTIERWRHHGNESNWSFGGSSCQTPATALCPVPTYENNPLNYFCANGGQCPPLSDYATGYCTCPPLFTGPRCEYRNNSPLARNCSLPCQNKGSCVFGTKDYNGLEQRANYSSFYGLHMNGMHCECPPGFAGLLCESSVEICSVKEQYACFNKAKCEKIDGITSCNCEFAGDGFNKQFAGSHCQFPATSWCEGKYRQPSSFCTNGGTCKDSMDTSSVFPGCNCNPGFSGDHCEFVFQSSILSTGPNSITKKSSHPVAAPLIITTIVLLSLLCAFVLYRRRRGRQQRSANTMNTFQDLNLAHEAPSPRPASSSQVDSSSSSQINSGSTFHEVKRDVDDMKEVEIL